MEWDACFGEDAQIAEISTRVDCFLEKPIKLEIYKDGRGKMEQGRLR